MQRTHIVNNYFMQK